VGEVMSTLYFVMVAFLLVAFFFWPRWGLFWWWRRTKQLRARTRVEDTLKYLYFCESEARRPTLQSIAGRLQISENQAAALVQTMQVHGLVQWVGEQLQLTPEGRIYALHIVRAHRLWERHLADETGIGERRWHMQADKAEHALSATDTDALAGRLGHPLFDPHGDPIPTSSGETAGAHGQALSTLPPGKTARIIHLEDEPDAVYAQLVAEGFYPGMVVQMLDQTQERVRVWAAGDEHLLAPIVAASMTVEPVAAPVTVSVESLADLRPPQRGRIREISPRCRGAERRRFLDLGIVPGTVVEAELLSPSGGLTAYRLRDTLIALRQEQASLIHIERLPLESKPGVQQETLAMQEKRDI
jgi:DtxR family Mn-dependent transcriptional regulator